LRALSGLHLLGLNERALRVHPLAVEKDAEFRAASDAAPRLDAAAVAKQQQAFVAASAARPSRAPGSEPAQPRMPWTPQGSALDAIRATHAKAYAPWTSDEDGYLKRRHQAGERVDVIAAAFGRKPGAIRSRLKKLGLV
jgi:hypothetical protein